MRVRIKKRGHEIKPSSSRLHAIGTGNLLFECSDFAIDGIFTRVSRKFRQQLLSNIR